jgi:hypothetical protein
MDVPSIEPRSAMWAVAEVFWEDPSGTPYRAPATLEDTSPSGACIRIKTAIAIGANLSVKWHREQFSGIARNCRSDGKEFLLGIQRDPAQSRVQASPPPQPKVTNRFAAEKSTELSLRDASIAELSWKDSAGTLHRVDATIDANAPGWLSLRLNSLVAAGSTVSIQWRAEQFPAIVKYCRWEGGTYLLGVQHEATRGRVQSSGQRGEPAADPSTTSSAESERATPKPESRQARLLADASQLTLATVPAQGRQVESRGWSHPQERKVMPSKSFFPKFWRALQHGAGAPNNRTSTEVAVNKINAPEVPAHSQADLLSCEDIYHASGILSARSGYGIGKIVDMLHSKHIRDLANDVRRASVLMALDAAGTTVEEVLQDATRRQHALNAYESGQKKQVEELEAAKQRENAQLQAEMERVTAHYAERIKHNLDQVAQEKDALCQWQKIKEEESRHISVAVALCTKQPPAPEAVSEAMPALPRTHAAVGSA